jgi:hypothetical protein
MAYRAFDGWPFDVAAQQADETTTAAPATEPVFTPLELHVLALAARDAAWSVRIVEALFGIRRPNPLANPRLEALRRFAVIVRNLRGSPPAAEIEAFLAAGFSPRAATALSSLSR